MKRLISLWILLVLSGCKVGPDYHPPDPPLPCSFVEDQVDRTQEVSDADLVRWWTIFNDPFLNGLLEETLEGSFDYNIAIEKIYQARAQYWIQFTQILPEIVSDAQASRFRRSQAFASNTPTSTTTFKPTTPSPTPIPTPTSVTPIQNFFQVGFDALWEIDLFGGLRRASAAAYDRYEASQDDARNIKISVLSEVARIYTVITAFQKRIVTTTEIVASDKEILDLLTDRFQAGLSNEQDMESARGTWAADRAALDAFQVVLKQNIYSLGIFLGRPPETIVEEFNQIRPIPTAEDKIPTSLPGELLRRRFDIRSAERNLAAATEEIGVAVAELYPKIRLIGSSSSFAANPLQGANVGWSSDEASKLFTAPSRIWGIGALITWPVFDFGRRQAGVEVQESLQHQTYLTYQKTVITALQEVEQALSAYFNEENRLRELNVEVDAFRKAYDLNLNLFNAGLIDFQPVLIAKDRWLDAFNTRIDSEQALATDLIAVYKALGGDW